MSDVKNVWQTLSAINVNEHTQNKGKFTYLSWTWAWSTIMDNYPDSTYSFRDNLNHNGSTEVWVDVSIGGITREMWLPVMDFKNKAVLNPLARDINDTRMRCLTKCFAMFGLGHYIYAGESLPDGEVELDMNKIASAVKFFVAGMESDKDETETVPIIIEKYNSLNMDEQMEINEQLKGIKIKSANNRQGNTVLKSFLEYKFDENIGVEE